MELSMDELNFLRDLVCDYLRFGHYADLDLLMAEHLALKLTDFIDMEA